MKNWLKIVGVFVLLIGVIIVFVMASEQEAKKQPKIPSISIHVDSENAFLTEQELLNRLKVQRLIFEGQNNEQLKVHDIELFIQ